MIGTVFILDARPDDAASLWALQQAAEEKPKVSRLGIDNKVTQAR
ncbi:hypothetical protein [Archangium violaceum]|nr:hypothetical protein [Archangium violaceum]